MAGTVTVSEETSSIVKMIVWSWTSTAGGAADLSTAEYYSGRVIGANFVPGAGGVQPTDQYDVTITDKNGLDVLLGTGANRSNAAADPVQGDLGCMSTSKLTLNVSGAGNAKSGTVYLFIR